MSGTDPNASRPESSPRHFLELIGLREGSARDGKASLRIDLEEKHSRTLGITHGGVIASLLDTLMGAAAESLCGDDRYVVTAQLNVNFIRPGWPGEQLIGDAEILHAGRMTAVGRGELRNQAGVLVASASATFLYQTHTDETRKQLARREDRDALGNRKPS